MAPLPGFLKFHALDPPMNTALLQKVASYADICKDKTNENINIITYIRIASSILTFYL